MAIVHNMHANWIFETNFVIETMDKQQHSDVLTTQPFHVNFLWSWTQVTGTLGAGLKVVVIWISQCKNPVSQFSKFFWYRHLKFLPENAMKYQQRACVQKSPSYHRQPEIITIIHLPNIVSKWHAYFYLDLAHEVCFALLQFLFRTATNH